MLEVGKCRSNAPNFNKEGGMNFKWDLKSLFKKKQQEISTKAQLRERSKQSIARPKAKTNITSKDPRLQGI
jgi:hypothetical protein